MAMELPLDFKEFLRLLNEHKVRYLLVGGYAVGYYGYPRATQDIDVWIDRNPENASRIETVLRVFGFDSSEISAGMFLKENSIIRMGLPPIRIEVTTGISGVDFNNCFAERVQGVLDGVNVNIINLPHLKLNKKASGRHKDLDDLENLP